MRRLIAGTRGSALALRQTELVEQALRARFPEIEMETRVIHTEGDLRQDVSLETFGGQGVFVKDIEKALLRGEIDLAVHSLKDMPAETPAGLTIASVLSRGDARDVLVTPYGKLEDLPPGARVGTDSRRRSVQLLAMRPDLKPTSMRGNVDSRVRKAMSGEIEAVILARAGLDRLGLGARVSQTFTIGEMLPAAGQASIAVEARTDDAEALSLLREIEDNETRIAIEAERAFLRHLGAGCRLPVAAYAQVKSSMVEIRGMVASESGSLHRHTLLGPAQDAEALGITLAETLIQAAGGMPA